MVRTLDDPSLDEHERKALEDIRDHGLHVVYVLPEGNMPGWMFSIGLYHHHQHPEVLVFGLNRQVAHWLVNEVARRVEAGERMADGCTADDLLEGVPCTFRAMYPGWRDAFLGWMDWFYKGADVPVLQCIWPDHDGKWPWQPEFRHDWGWAQPLLFLRDPVAARATELLQTVDLWPPPASPDHPA